MTRIIGPLATALLPLSLSFGASAMVAGEGPQPGATLAKLPACELRVERQGGSVVLEGEVHATRAAAGSYRLKIWQAGASSSSISQGGDFAVPAGGSSSLGLVSLPAGGSYGATLTVNFDDDTVDCKATAHALRPVTAK